MVSRKLWAGKVPERLLHTDQISILINGTEFISDTMMIQSSIIREGKPCTLLAQLKNKYEGAAFYISLKLTVFDLQFY